MLDGHHPEIETTPETQPISLERLDLIDKRGVTHHTISVGDKVMGGMVIAGIAPEVIKKLFPEAEDLLPANPYDEPKPGV